MTKKTKTIKADDTGDDRSIALLEQLTEKLEPILGEYRSIAILDQIMATVEPFVWIKDANISNVANGGQPEVIQVYIVDSAWITNTEYGPQFHHRYEIELFEGSSLRANIAVTFGLLFDPFDKDPDLQVQYFQLESDRTGQIDLFRKSGLYKHSWPHLREFVEHTVKAFGWSPVELPEQFEPTSTPISSAYLQRLDY